MHWDLIETKGTLPLFKANETQSFTYDANGNRLTATTNSAVQSYGYHLSSNRLMTVSGPRNNAYDASGNLISDGARSYTYDARGRLTQAIGPSPAGTSLTTTYLINAQGQRVKKSNAAETKLFVYDDAGHMLGEYDATGKPVQELVRLGSTPVAVLGTLPAQCVWQAILAPGNSWHSPRRRTWKSVAAAEATRPGKSSSQATSRI